MAEFDDLKTGAERIRDEVADRANTALRIGTWNLGILNWVKSIYDTLLKKADLIRTSDNYKVVYTVDGLVPAVDLSTYAKTTTVGGTVVRTPDGTIPAVDISGKVDKKVIYNVTQVTGVTYSDKTTARNAIPTNLRGLGQIITYKLSTGWVNEQYIGADVNGWSTESNWKIVGEVTKADLALKADLGGSDKTLRQVDEKIGVPFSKRIIEFKRFDGVVNANTGVISAGNGYNFYTRINVIGYSKVYYPLFRSSAGNGVAFLDASGNYISGFSYNGTKVGNMYLLNIPTNATEFLFCYNTDEYAESQGYLLFSYLELQSNTSIDMAKRIEVITPEYILQNATPIDTLIWHDNESINTDGTYVTREKWRRSEPITLPIPYTNNWYITTFGGLTGVASVLYRDSANKVTGYIENNPNLTRSRLIPPLGSVKVEFTTTVESLTVDSGGNIILPFKLESAKTYSFNENLIAVNKRIDEISFDNRTIYSQDFKNALVDFTANTWTVANGKLNSPASYALAYWNKNTTNEQVNTRIRVTVNDITSRFAIIRKTAEGFGGTVAEINCSTLKLNFYADWNGTANPSANAILKSVDIPFSFIAGREYIIELLKQVELSTLRITDALTFHTVDLIYSQETDANLTGMGVGRHWGNPGIAFFSGSVSVSKFEYVSLVTRKPSVLSIGDSFSEMFNLPPTMQSKWNSLLKDEIKDVVIAGRGGATSSSILSRLDADLLSFKPRFVILLIGANDTVYNTWLTNVTTIIAKIKSTGAIPVLGTIAPRYDRMGFINQANAYIRNSGIRYVDFNLVLTANNDGVTWNPDLVQSDLVHPNALGFQVMYNRVKVDLPEVFDSNN